MHIAFPIFLLAATTIAGSVLARYLKLSAPLLLVAVGAAVSYIPIVPPLRVDSEVVLLGFLPPLLYAAARRTSLVDLRRDVYQIVQLSVLLVAVTAVAVGFVAYWVMPITLAAGLALGGVVAPPDAVAATAVARRIGLPRRLVDVLEGESLFNDATALVIVATATTAMTSDVSAGTTAVDFLIASVGGIAIGVAAYAVMALIQRRIRDTVTSVALTYMTPWVAFLPAEAVHSSGVVAVVVAGVLLGYRAPYIQSAQARVSEQMNWDSIQFLLENMVFLLIGLQVAEIVEDVTDSDVGLARTMLYAAIVLLVVMVVRPIFLIGTAWLGRVSRRDSRPLTLREAAVGGWAGMRGVVTLAAAFLLPQDQPYVQVLVFIALVVTVGTLVIQGFSLGAVASALKLRAPDAREDALARAQVLQAAVNAGEAELHKTLEEPEFADVPEGIVKSLEKQGFRRANLAWERLGSGDEVTPTQQYRVLRTGMLKAEREQVLHARDSGQVDSEVIEDILLTLDIEESMITVADSRDEEVRGEVLLTPEERKGDCEHLCDAAESDARPQSHEGCQACLETGMKWVHLRMCLECGYVGCCDSSPGQHASKHFHDTGHPVIRSFEPGEKWRWCMVDRLPG